MSTWHPDPPALYSGWQDGVRASALEALLREVYGRPGVPDDPGAPGVVLPAHGGGPQAGARLRRARDAARERGLCKPRCVSDLRPDDDPRRGEGE